MSIEAVALVLLGAHGLAPSAKLLLVILADCVNDRRGDGLAFPSIATMAVRAGICVRQVRLNLRALEAAGYVSRVGATHGGRGMTARYRVNLGRVANNIAAQKAATHCRVLPGDNSAESRRPIAGIGNRRRQFRAPKAAIYSRKPGNFAQ